MGLPNALANELSRRGCLSGAPNVATDDDLGYFWWLVPQGLGGDPVPALCAPPLPNPAAASYEGHIRRARLARSGLGSSLAATCAGSRLRMSVGMAMLRRNSTGMDASCRRMAGTGGTCL